MRPVVLLLRGDVAERVEKREGEEHSLRDLFVQFVESYPAITLGAVTREELNNAS